MIARFSLGARRARAVLRGALVGGALGLGLGLALVPATAQAQYAIDLPLGSTLPDLKVETLDGKPASVATYLGKGPLLIEVWATWCENCKALEPTMRAAMTKYGSQVKFVTIAVSVNQSLERVKAWQAQNKLAGEMLFDRKGAVSGAFDAPATSYVVVVDKTGKVVYTGLGGTQNIEAAIRKAL